MNKFKVDHPLEEWKLVAVNGPDKMYLVGTSDIYGDMVVTIVDGVESEPWLAIMVGKHSQDWEEV